MGVLANTQYGIKKGTLGIGLLIFKLLSASIFSYTLALIGRGLMYYGNFAFWFVFLISFGLFMRATKNWAFVGVLILNLFLFLVGLLLRMYVLVAPGA